MAGIQRALERIDDGASGMSNDTKWVIGTVVTLAGVLGGLMLAQFSSVNGRIDELGSRIDDLRSVVRGMDERLRAVEVELAEVRVRLQTVENGLSEVRVRLRAVENGLSGVGGPEPGDSRNPAGP